MAKGKKRAELVAKKRAAKEARMSRPGGASRYALAQRGAPARENSPPTPPKAACGRCYLRPCRCSPAVIRDAEIRDAIE